MSLYGTPPEPVYGSPADAVPGAMPPAPAAPMLPKCSACGSQAVEPGFVEDNGEGSQGFVRWIPGPLERGIFGGARRMGRPRFEVIGVRCQHCSHLDLYVGNQV